MSRHQRATEGPGSRVTKSIGSLIGLAGEAYAHRKDKKALAQGNANAATTTPPNDVYDDHAPDEEDWALDDASMELFANSQAYSVPDNARFETAPPVITPLPCPIILPQRRPQTKERGFVNAYAPLLGSCKGIDEATFLNFLSTFQKEAQASDFWQVLNVGAFVAGNIPSVIAMAVSMTAGATASAGISIQGRYRTNTYLDRVNQELFHPVNVHAMVMTFKPDPARQSSPLMDIDINAHDIALAKDLQSAENPGTFAKMKNSSGKTRSEWAIPESAPLIYSKIDNAAKTLVEQGGVTTPETTAAAAAAAGAATKQPNALKRSTAFVQSYLDNRSQAEYAGVHGASSALSNPSATSSSNWATRFADPNHPANAGSIAALLTGGRFDPRATRRLKVSEFKASRQGETLTVEEQNDIKMRRGGGGESRGPIRKGLKKVMAEDVLYLVIAEMPSREQMEGMMREYGGASV